MIVEYNMPRKATPTGATTATTPTAATTESTATAIDTATKTTSAKKASSKKVPSKKAPASAKSTKSTKSAVVTATATTESTVEVMIDATPEVTSMSVLQDEFGEFLGKLNQVSTQFASLRTDFRGLEKKWTRELKIAQKNMDKRKRKVGNRAPSGFVKPTLISDELASFLGKTIGTEMARTEVTREINKYIRANALQDKENGRKINADAALSSLLKLTSEDELTYFNLQRYMSPHFAKLGQAVPAANIIV
jgi:chromatin remodeling complex protein RSC6